MTNIKLEQAARQAAVSFLKKIKDTPKESLANYPYLVGLRMELWSLESDEMEQLIKYVTVELKQIMVEYAGNCHKILMEYQELKTNPLSALHLKIRLRSTINTLKELLDNFDEKEDLIVELEEKENKTEEEIKILETLKEEKENKDG